MRQNIKMPTPRPDSSAPLTQKIFWLIENYGFDKRANKVVMLYEPSGYCSLTLDAFKTEYMSWYEDQQRERGAPKRVYATAAWMLHPRRVAVAGIRMRPDKGFPCYLEGGEIYKNTYRQPVHEGAEQGEIRPFLKFLDRFIPLANESDFWLEWMAHKLRYPEVPGTSVWFVAATRDGSAEGMFGTGRGMMFRILHALYGPSYCKNEDFDILAGTSAQAVYTDWQAYCVLVTVDEAHVSPTAHRRGEKRAVYTALKNCIDPAAKRRSFKTKGGQAFDGTSYCSVVVATNHVDAAAIPEDDRRITVLRNGTPMTPQEAKTLNAWIEAPGSIAALAEYLGRVDLTNFDMYTALRTDAKTEMVEAGQSEMDEILIDFAADEDRGLCFPKLFLERAVERHLTGGGERGGAGREWRSMFEGAFRSHCTTVRPSNGSVNARIRIGGERYRLYCFRNNARSAGELNETERRKEAAKWGHIDSIQTVLREVNPGRKSGSNTKSEGDPEGD